MVHDFRVVGPAKPLYPRAGQVSRSLCRRRHQQTLSTSSKRSGREPLVVVAVDCSATNLRRSVNPVAARNRSVDRDALHSEARPGCRAGSSPRATRCAYGQRPPSRGGGVPGLDGARRSTGDPDHRGHPSDPVDRLSLLRQHSDRRGKNDAFFADLSEDAPVVYLNSSFEGLPELLSDDEKAAYRRTRPSRGRVPPDRDVRLARNVQRRGGRYQSRPRRKEEDDEPGRT